MKKIVVLFMLFILSLMSISSSFADRFNVPISGLVTEKNEDALMDLIFEFFGKSSEGLDIFIRSDNFNDNDELMIIYNQVTKEYSPVNIAQINTLRFLQQQLEDGKEILNANKILFIVLTKNIKISPFFARVLIDKAKEERRLISCCCPYLRVSKLINDHCRKLIQCEYVSLACGNG